MIQLKEKRVLDGMTAGRKYLVTSAVFTVASGYAYQTGFNSTYLPDEEPDYLSAYKVPLVMSKDVEDFVYTGSPSSFTGSASSLTVPLGFILKEFAEEILEDRFSGGTDFANVIVHKAGYSLALQPKKNGSTTCIAS